MFLEECKYVVKEEKMPKYITDDVKISSDKNSDEENSNKKKTLMKKIIVKNKCLF